MLRTKQIAGTNKDAASVINCSFLFMGSLDDINVQSAKKVWRPKKVTTKPQNLKSFKDSCGAIKGMKIEKINLQQNKNDVLNIRVLNILTSTLLITTNIRLRYDKFSENSS